MHTLSHTIERVGERASTTPTVAMKIFSSDRSSQPQNPQHIGHILPEVLARYGLGADFEPAEEAGFAPSVLRLPLAELSLTDVAFPLSVS